MVPKLDRRQFVAGAARRSCRRGARFRLRPGPGSPDFTDRLAGGDRVGEWPPLHERWDPDVRGDRVPPDDLGHGRARRAHRRGEHRRAGPRGRQRRLRRPSQRGRGGSARRLLHARAETAGRRGRGARGRAHTVQRGAEGRRPDRSSPAGRGRRATVRATARVRHRGRPETRTARAACGSNGSAAPIPATISIPTGPRPAGMLRRAGVTSTTPCWPTG